MSWKTKLSYKNAKKRADIIRNIRDFFYRRGIIEVDVPTLSHGTVTDPYLDAFKCNFNYNQDPNTPDTLYLQTSPEYAMKRLLASGYDSIYYLGKAFRHEAFGTIHNPEFTILEWYRVGFDYHQLMDEVEVLLCTVLQVDECERLSYQHTFLRYLSIDPLATTISELKSTLQENGILGDWIDDETDMDILLQVLFSECIEEKIGQDKPCFVYDYPASQASLSRLSAADSRVAERFECYYKSVELVNGFSELTDANEQKHRFEQDNVKRQQIGQPTKPIDQKFLDALHSGIPQCSGVALGIDRLIMLALNIASIDQVLTYFIKNA